MRALILVSALLLGGCSSTSLDKWNIFQTNFNKVVAGINADIAAVAPAVTRGCTDVRQAAVLIQPFLPKDGRAPQYFDAANAALIAYCQTVPTDIKSTLVALQAAAVAAWQGYDAVVGAK